MSLLIVAVVVGVVVVGVAVYQLVKKKLAVTVSSVDATVKADASDVKSDIKKL